MQHSQTAWLSSYLTTTMHVFASKVFITQTTKDPDGKQTHSLDCHGATMDFTYVNCYVDNGMSISGIGHTVENLTSTSGHFFIYEGGTDLTFKNIDFIRCKGFYTNNSIHRVKFIDVKLNLYSYNRYSIAPNSSNVVFERISVINTKFREASSNLEADKTVINYKQGYIGLLLQNNFSVLNSYIEGFPEGLYLAGYDCYVSNVTIHNCGWLSNYTDYECALHINGSGSRSYISKVRISFDKKGFTLGSPMRLDYFEKGQAALLRIDDVIHGRKHSVSYGIGVYGDENFKDVFMTHCYLYPLSHKWYCKGKFIANNIVADN